MNNHIITIDKFNHEIIDHDIIVKDKTFFNIYNNSIDEPFHKFWFLIENAKLTNIYNENTVLRFALNNKSEKNKKLLDYLNELFEYLKKLFINIYPEIIIETPWKENENYPYLIYFNTNNNTICLDTKQNNKDIKDINKDQIYSILFELSYIQIAKIIINNKINHVLKFKFSLIMIQEKIFDIKSCFLENLNQLNNPKYSNNQNSSRLLNQQMPNMSNVFEELNNVDKKILN